MERADLDDIVRPGPGREPRHQVGCQFPQRHEDERPLEHPGMWNDQVRIIDRLPVDPEQVHVERARPPADLPDPSGSDLTGLRCCENLVGAGRGEELDDAVQVRVLPGAADRRRLVDG